MISFLDPSDLDEKNNINVDDDEKNNVDDDENDDECFLSSPIYRDSHVTFYSSDARDFVLNIKIWSAQRKLDDNHVNKLMACLKNNKHFIGTFKVVRSGDDIRLIDGQHRFMALKRVMENDSKFNMNVIIELYETTTLESEKTISLFREANNCLNVEIDDMPDIAVTNVIEFLQREYPDMLKDVCSEKRCYRPFLNKRKLYNRLKDYVIENDVDEKYMRNGINKQNREYGMISIKTFSKKFGKTSNSMYAKCKDSGLYLGLDSTFSWIKNM